MEKKIMPVVFSGATDIGQLRKRNEDSIRMSLFNNDEIVLLQVADGVGGNAGGDVASQWTVEFVEEYISTLITKLTVTCLEDTIDLSAILLSAIEAANAALIEQQNEQPQFHNMATTWVGVISYRDEMVIGHLGDSRCYQYDQNELLQLTQDHTMLQDMLNKGEITQDEFNVLPMHNIISRGVGLVYRPDVALTQASHIGAKQYLLCSDGLTNCLTDTEIHTILTNELSFDDTVEALITAANEAGGLDNISVLLVKKEG